MKRKIWLEFQTLTPPPQKKKTQKETNSHCREILKALVTNGSFETELAKQLNWENGILEL